jgi:transposase InsO family protein
VALRMALADRRPGPGMVHHSDRGVQYASESYTNLLKHAARNETSRASYFNFIWWVMAPGGIFKKI